VTRFIEVKKFSEKGRPGSPILLNVATITSVEPTELYGGGEGSYVTTLDDGSLTLMEKYVDLVATLRLDSAYDKK